MTDNFIILIASISGISAFLILPHIGKIVDKSILLIVELWKLLMMIVFVLVGAIIAIPFLILNFLASTFIYVGTKIFSPKVVDGEK